MSGGFDLQLAQLLEQLLAFRDRPRLVHLRVAHDALRVEHVSGAPVHAPFLVEDAVGLAYRAVRPVVGKQGEGNAAQLFRPTLEAGGGVGADVQNLVVQLLEFVVVRTEPVDLVRSPPVKANGMNATTTGRPLKLPSDTF